MGLTRVIHPIGQGGFYTETLKNRNGDEFNVVYDCGGNSKTSMENYLNKLIHDDENIPKKKVDAIFISHLHADHVNGLEYLIDNVYTRYLFLPQLTDDMVFEVLFYNILSYNRRNVQKMTEFVIDLYEDGRERYHDTRIIKVSPADDESSVDMEGDSNSIDLSIGDISNSMINSGVKIHFGTPWLYIPYNPPVKSHKAESFYEFIKKELKISYDFWWNDLPKIIEKATTKKLREIYAQYFGSDHNAYSMTLFSGLCKPYCYEYFHHNHYRYCGCHKFRYTPNCLYTGDFESKDFVSNLRKFYKPLWKTISYIQVPHHGSRDNYHPFLYDFAIDGFISVGEKNKYHHPNIDALINIQRQGCRPMVVTEDLSTMIVQGFLF